MYLSRGRSRPSDARRSLLSAPLCNLGPGTRTGDVGTDPAKEQHAHLFAGTPSEAYFSDTPTSFLFLGGLP